MGERAWLTDRRFPDPNGYPHGTRSRYVQAKCRCDECRAANRASYHQLKARRRAAAGELPQLPSGSPCPGVNGSPCPYGVKLRRDSIGVCERCQARLVFNGMVDATPAREYIEKLSQRGVGYRTVADAARVAESTIWKIWTGKRKFIRAQLLRRVLAVDESVRADGSRVPAGPTWRLVKAMIARGWTKGAIAQALGRKVPALQIRRGQVLLSTAAAVRKLYKKMPDPPSPRRRPGPAPRPCSCERPIPVRDCCARCERQLPARAREAA